MAVYHRHPSAFPLNFVIIGAGGTGSRLIPMVAQLIKSLPFMAMLRPAMFIIDDDIVEEKNLARQLFAPSDVGKGKAEVLANRYGSVYGVEMHAIKDRVNHRDSLATFTIGTLIEKGMSPEEALRTMARRTVVVTAVDSMESRRWCIASALHLPSPLNITFIDPGNEDTFGQVSIFNAMAQCKVDNAMMKGKIDNLPDLCPVALETAYIPMPLVHYFLTPDGERTGGCADLDQTLALNSMAASRSFDYIQAMMYNVPLPTTMTRFGLGGEASCQKMDVRWMKRISYGQEYGVSDYDRLLELTTGIAETDFHAKAMEDSTCGDWFFKHLKKDVVLSDACRLILNQCYFIPSFNIVDVEARIEKHNADRIAAAKAAVKAAQQAAKQEAKKTA